jgi:DNA-binding transcriptional MerR regulator
LTVILYTVIMVPVTIEELARKAGTSVRTIRFYIAEGILPRPEGAGRASRYTEEHLQRLETILRLRQRNLPLAEIRRAVVGVPVTELPASTDSALDYIDRLLGQQGRRVATSPPAVPVLQARNIATAAEPPALMAPQPAPGEPAELVDRRGAPVGEQWRRVRIHPDVELSIREPVPPGLASRLPQLLERLRRIVEGKED